MLSGRGALVTLVLAGCVSGQPVSLETPARTFQPGDYSGELKRWTRHGHLRHEWDAALDVSATFRSPEFRSAYAERYASLYRVASSESARVKSELISDGADTFEFHVEVATHKFELANLGGAKHLWRITLSDDKGREINATEIMPTKTRPLDVVFYPYATDFSAGWRLRFSRTLPDGSPLLAPDTRALTLRFAGPEGAVDLTWLLR